MPDAASARRRAARTGADTDIAEGWSPAILSAIARDEIRLALWHRLGSTALADWLDGLPADRLPAGRVLVHPPQAAAALTVLFDDAATPDCALRTRLLADMAGLVHRFSRIARSEWVDIRVDRIDGDACWRFHRDNVDLRLLTTYRGPGTQWVQNRYAARAIARQERYAGPIAGVPRFAVALFRGDEISAGAGIVHRSPPISGSGVTRLLFCLNLPSMTSPPLWRD